MSETTGETWAVVGEAGVRHEVGEAGAIHEVDVSEGRTGAPPWVAHVADGTARRSLTSARDAVVMMAQARKWSIAEVLAPGQETAARAALADAFARGADLQRGMIRAFAVSADPAEIDAVMSPTVPDDLGAEVHARRLLDAVRDALGPTCADATHEALPGLVAEVVACDAAMHHECDEQRDRLREMAAEVAHLEARRGALLAEVDRLTAAQYVGGGNAEDWRALAVENADGWSKTTNELLAAREALATARLDGAREMRERAAGVCDAERAAREATGDALRAPTYWWCIANEHRRAAEAIRALLLTEAPAPLPKTPLCECGAAASGTRYVGSGSDGPHRTPCCRAHGGETYEVARG